MRLYTIRHNGEEKVAVRNEHGMVMLDSVDIRVSDMNELIGRYDELADLIRTRMGTADDVLKDGSYEILAPVPVPLQDIICLGVNYKEHIEETVNILDFTKKKDAVYFSKRVNRANDPDGEIPVYDFVDSLDHEVELGVILKKDAIDVSVEDAGEYILGYTIINDVSARNLQFKHQQWYRGKSLDGYTPMGPCIVTSDEIGDPHDLAIRCFINDEMRQDSNTSLMITTVEEAISELSQGMTLKAGTIIATGTPGGVCMGMKAPVFLKDGDIVRCEIEGIGQLVNRCGSV